jgi:hypothetical protein
MDLLESDSARPRQARYQAALRPDVLILSFYQGLRIYLEMRAPHLCEELAETRTTSGCGGAGGYERGVVSTVFIKSAMIFRTFSSPIAVLIIA